MTCHPGRKVLQRSRKPALSKAEGDLLIGRPKGEMQLGSKCHELLSYHTGFASQPSTRVIAESLFCRNNKHRLPHAHIVMPVVGPHGDQMLASLAIQRLGR